MNPQLPAQGILQRNSWGDSKVYQVVCQCHCEDHDHHLWVEAEESDITVTVYTTVKSDWWSKTRWQAIWKLLTKGYIDTEASLIMDKQQALNYANVLTSAINDVEDFRKVKNAQ
jgi:hypothetical protein